MGELTTALACLVSVVAGAITGFMIGFCTGREEPR